MLGFFVGSPFYHMWKKFKSEETTPAVEPQRKGNAQQAAEHLKDLKEKAAEADVDKINQVIEDVKKYKERGK